MKIINTRPTHNTSKNDKPSFNKNINFLPVLSPFSVLNEPLLSVPPVGTLSVLPLVSINVLPLGKPEY